MQSYIKTIYIYILWSKIREGNFYSSVPILGTSFLSVKWLEFWDFICLKGQLCAIAGVGQNSTSCKFFIQGGMGMELKICKICEIHAIGVKSMDLVVTWPNKFLSGEFCGKVVKIGQIRRSCGYWDE